MTNAKEYQLLFLLKAQMDSAFGGSFASARQTVAQLQSEVRQYNQTLRDISAYNAHTQKLEVLKTRYAETEAKLGQLASAEAREGAETTEMSAKKTQLEAQLKRLQEQMDTMTDRTNREAEALREAGVDTENLTSEEEKLRQKTQEVTQEMQQWQGLSTTVSGISDTLMGVTLITDGLGSAMKTVLSGIGECIDSASELEYTMSAVEAVSGATAQETEELTALAQQLGADTVYTSAEVAEALETMGLAGATAEEMISGIPAVVNLAAASGEDLAEMTSIVMDGMNAFGLSGEQAVNEFSDTLAKAATSSNTTVGVLGESLSYVESTAANLGYSIQDVSVALAQMANNSLKGSVSGSALNTMLTRMSGANANAASEMEELGLSMYDSSGQAKELSVFLEELRDAFRNGGMSAQEMQVAAYNLAGQRGMRGLLSIVTASDEEWNSLTDAINDYNGAAGEISTTRLENYAGKIEYLEGAWDALKTTIGDAFLPVAGSAAEVLEGLTDGVNELAQEHQTLIVAFGGAAAGAVSVTTAISAAATVAFAAKTVFAALGLELKATAAAVLPVIGIAAVIGGVVAATASYASQLEVTQSEIQKVAEETEATVEATQESVDGWDEVSQKYDDQRASAENLIAVLETLQGEDQGDFIVQRETASVVEQLNELLPELGLEYDSLTGKLSMTTEEMRSFNDTMTDSEIDEKTAALAEMEAQQEALATAYENAQAAYESAQAAYDQGVTDAGGYAYAVDPQLQDDLNAAQQAVQQAKAEYETYSQTVSNAKEELREFTQAQEEEAAELGLTADVLTEVQEAAQAYADAWQEAYDSAYESLSGQIDLFNAAEETSDVTTQDILDNLNSQLEQYQEYQQNLQTLNESGIDFGSLWDSLSDGSADAMGAVQDMAVRIKEGSVSEVQQVVDKYSELEDTVSETSAAIASGMEDVKQLGADLENAISLDSEEMRASALEAAQQTIAGAAEGLSNTATVAQKGTKMGNDTIKSINEALGVNSPSKYTKQAGQYTIEGLTQGMEDKKAALLKKADTIAAALIQEFRTQLAESKFKTFGRSAVQGAIDGAEEKRSAIVAEFRSLGEAAAQAYKEAQDINSPSRLFAWYSEMDVAGIIQGAQENTADVQNAMRTMGEESAEAYALSRGAEMVTISPLLLEAIGASKPRQTTGTSGASYYSSASTNSQAVVIQLEYAPVIHTDGNTDAADIRTQLAEHAADLQEMIRETVRGMQDEEYRREY